MEGEHGSQWLLGENSVQLGLIIFKEQEAGKREEIELSYKALNPVPSYLHRELSSVLHFQLNNDDKRTCAFYLTL